MDVSPSKPMHPCPTFSNCNRKRASPPLQCTADAIGHWSQVPRTVSSSKSVATGRDSRRLPPNGRVAKLMALAIRFDQLIRDGVVADQAELARLGYVTSSRISQILALLQLAPDIQEAILFLPPTERGRDPVTEQHLRPIAAVADWRRQRPMWRRTVK